MGLKGRKRKPSPITLPGQQGRLVELVEVDDPYEVGGRLTVVKNVSTSPLDHLYARGRLCTADESEQDAYARKLAGEWVRVQYERSELSDAKAIDYSQVKVDVSFSYGGLSESKAESLQILKRLADHIGRTHYRIVYEVCGREVGIDDYLRAEAPAREPGRNDRLKAYQALREGLDMVIDFRGVAVGRGWKMRAQRAD